VTLPADATGDATTAGGAARAAEGRLDAALAAHAAVDGATAGALNAEIPAAAAAVFPFPHGGQRPPAVAAVKHPRVAIVAPSIGCCKTIVANQAVDCASAARSPPAGARSTRCRSRREATNKGRNCLTAPRRRGHWPWHKGDWRERAAAPLVGMIAEAPRTSVAAGEPTSARGADVVIRDGGPVRGIAERGVSAGAVSGRAAPPPAAE